MCGECEVIQHDLPAPLSRTVSATKEIAHLVVRRILSDGFRSLKPTAAVIFSIFGKRAETRCATFPQALYPLKKFGAAGVGTSTRIERSYQPRSVSPPTMNGDPGYAHEMVTVLLYRPSTTFYCTGRR